MERDSMTMEISPRCARCANNIPVVVVLVWDLVLQISVMLNKSEATGASVSPAATRAGQWLRHQMEATRAIQTDGRGD